ncbi:MAG: RNA-binding domain-containing protein [Candidatus Nitrosotenuis sp.]|uniref:Uncharacterized protein n=1 Tax=Candidatus Nitrosotenuis uzonensis TaxID=1407055 RepID=V6AVJ5_9ARCH|nr:RNA-binding domain-containing protein [Candidatus Nitrosotenuis uzonensis]CDI06614.1 conserved hypothetical protein [Candidatus Nitrosotenuis uzonensis]
MIPQVDCTVEVVCQINPSEDPQKIRQSISNILDAFELELDKYSARATSDQAESLAKIRESIHNHHSQRVYSKFLNNNLEGDSTWFYLNKQAAFANSIALCERDNESPLGPIKVTVSSENIERIIEWLTS